MTFIYPILAVMGEAVGKTIDKLNFNRNKIQPGELIFILFSTMVAGLLISLVFVRQPLPPISLGIAILILFMIAISFAQNFFDFKGLSLKNLSLREPISNFEPILASFLAFILFPTERELKYIAAICIGAAILYIGNSSRRLRLQFDSGVAYLLLGMVCSAILANVYKLGLESVAPVYLLLFRAGGVLVLARLFLRLNLTTLSRNQIRLAIAAGLVYLTGNLTRLYSIQSFGLNLTILLLLLGPVLVYLFSALVLREKIQVRQVVTSAALLIVVISAIVS